MFHHIVLLKIADDAPAGRVAEITNALGALPTVIPEIRSYSVRADLGLDQANADISVQAGFDDQAAWRTYGAHPAHQRVLRELIEPVLAHASPTQFVDAVSEMAP